MRKVVVLPQPEGPSNVVKLPRGMSSETSSTAAWPPPEKRFVRFTRRTWTCSGIRHLFQSHPPTRNSPDQEQHADGHGDHGHRKGGRPAPVEVIDQLEDGDGRHRRRWSE